MAEEKKVEDEVVDQENENQVEQKSSIRDLIIKYRLYLGIVLGTVVIAIVAVVLFSGGDSGQTLVAENELSEEVEHHGETADNNIGHDDEVSGHDYATRQIKFKPNNEQADPREPTLEEAIYEWTPEELMELARLKSMPADSTPKDSDEVIDIDTVAIMQELEAMFAQPDIDESILNMTPQDSIDTLNWIETEMAALYRERQELTRRQKELEKMESQANRALSKIDQVESQRIINLARLYDNMKPLEVAKLFMNLDDSLVLQILPRMKPGNASKILALMPPKRAARISTQMVTIVE